MYRWGARGVLAEPDSDQVGKLRAKRPNDLVIHAGIAFDECRAAMLCRYQNRLFNSFDPYRDGTWSGTIEVPLVLIKEVFAANFSGAAPHFISIDTEGVDYEILASLDFARFRPFIICVELGRPIADFTSLVAPWNYHLIVHTMHNAMFAWKRN